MTPLEKRIKVLKQFLADEESSDNPSELYIEDLKESIAHCEMQLQQVSDKGYRMVG